MNLTPENECYIREAEGWLELGDHVAAFNALEEIEPRNRVHPRVLRLRWRIYAKAEKWANAFTVAEALARLVPDDVDAFIWRSYAARRMSGGSVQQAFDLLSDVADDFPEAPCVSFNLACYLCQLGRLDEARTWLHRSFASAEKTGETMDYKMRALDEPDLEPLRKNASL